MTALLSMLAIELPIIQAPMAGVQDAALAIAVSNAGGLGSLPCAMLDAAGLRQELEAIRRQTSKPYNVNFFCHAVPEHDAAAEAAWLDTLAPYYREFGLPLQPSTGPTRAPFSPELATVLEEFRPPVVSFHFGLPSEDLVGRVRSWGAKVLSSATTVEEALWLESHGVDAVIAQGVEAGGHRGTFLTDDLTTQIGTFALVPQIVKQVRVPVIASGGIADAAGVAAALRLGASAVQIGTAYLLCREAKTSPLHRAALQRADARHTALTNLFSGRPARGIVNRVMREIGPMHPAAPRFPLATSGIAPLRAAAEARGNGDFSPLWAGQNVTGCVEIGAGDLTRRLGASDQLPV
jgi:nitronate monooxygenase